MKPDLGGTYVSWALALLTVIAIALIACGGAAQSTEAPAPANTPVSATLAPTNTPVPQPTAETAASASVSPTARPAPTTSPTAAPRPANTPEPTLCSDRGALPGGDRHRRPVEPRMASGGRNVRRPHHAGRAAAAHTDLLPRARRNGNRSCGSRENRRNRKVRH